MRLLNAKDFKLTNFTNEGTTPDYAILSHTWGEEEITFRDFTELPHSQLALRKAYVKIEKCCLQALEWELEWVWIDTCCIDQQSSAELSEAINSMYQWYKHAAVCYAYLNDATCVQNDFNIGVENSSDMDAMRREKTFQNSRWFTRGWCLQELLAPRNMQFFNTDWIYIGSKHSLKTFISAVTGIDEYGLFIPDLSVLSVAHRMSWAARRQTTRAEDVAYCLLGIFNINMPLLYGEGEVRAFGRLQEEIMKRTEDDSIFAWSGKGIDFRNDMVGFLAPHPSCFSYGRIDLSELPGRTKPLSITGRGIRAHLPLILNSDAGYDLVVLGCRKPTKRHNYYAIPITPLKQSSDIYRRITRELLEVTPEMITGKLSSTSIFLLRHSRPTHLEDTDTMQVWMSLLEMRDCFYYIQETLPSQLWNVSRRVFAFSPEDFDPHTTLAILFSSRVGRGFSLRIDLDLEKGISISLMEGQDEFLKLKSDPMWTRLSLRHHRGTKATASDAAGAPLQISEKYDTSGISQLILGPHIITTIVERQVVFEQLLYEIKMWIHKK